jgi:hypothetical protein
MYNICIGFYSYFFASKHVVANISLRSLFYHKFSVAQTMNPRRKGTLCCVGVLKLCEM